MHYNECCDDQPNNAIEQAVNDAMADRFEELQGYVDASKSNADASATSETNAGLSANEAKGYRDQTETIYQDAQALVPSILETSQNLEDAAVAIEAALDVASDITVKTVFYTIVGGEKTIELDEALVIRSVQALYIEGFRQDRGEQFEYDHATRTITLADELDSALAGSKVTIILGTLNSDSGETIDSTLASNQGASMVGTTAGITVQQTINNFSSDTGASTIGTASGESVQVELDKLNNRVDESATPDDVAQVSARVDGRNSVDGQTMKALNDIELAVNALGTTLDGNIIHRVDFTASQTDTQSRLLYALQSIPSGHVLERIIAFGSVYATLSIRPVIPRVTVGKPSFTYAEVTYNGAQFYTITVRGSYINKMRMSYVDGTLRTPAATIEYLGIRYVRALINASPVGTGNFPTTINNGKLIPGNADNTYFLSSCFFTADGKLEVVPHKDTLVEEVVRNYYYNHDAVQAMHFRYVLVKDGAVYDLVENGYTTVAGWETVLSGRTSIGQKENGDLVLAVTDGNTSANTGVSVKGMAEYMLSQGCVNAMNLDGSGSSTMYYANELKNTPSDGAERQMINVIYFI